MGYPNHSVGKALARPVAAITAMLGRTCGGHPAALMAGTLYCLSSGANTLLNKEVLARHGFHAVHLLLLFHCALAVMFVYGVAWAGVARLEPLTRDVLRLWLPVNVIFVGMLATNFYALQSVGVGMVGAQVREGFA
jgi:GDP-mannose transporter